MVLVEGWWRSSAGKVTAGLVESNGSLPLGDDLKSPVGWLSVHWDRFWAQWLIMRMGELCFTQPSLFNPFFVPIHYCKISFHPVPVPASINIFSSRSSSHKILGCKSVNFFSVSRRCTVTENFRIKCNTVIINLFFKFWKFCRSSERHNNWNIFNVAFTVYIKSCRIRQLIKSVN